MAELSDLISELKEGNKSSEDKLGAIVADSRNSRRHLLEMKKSMFSLAENIQRMADVPPPPPGPTEGEQTEQRREDRKFAEKQLAALEKIANGITGQKAQAGGSGGGKGLGGLLSGLAGGLGIGAFAAAALKGAAGLVAMGVAIPAFFGGLLAGDKALEFMKTFGADFNYTSLKAAALGFSDMIMSMDVKAFTVLGTIMAVSAVGGTKAAKGLGTMGIAISAFLGGLLVGDALIGAGASMGWLDLNFTSLAAAMTGFSNAILGLTPESATVLGAIVVAGAAGGIFGKKPTDVGTGVAAIGAGIAGLFLGLAVGDAAMGWLGSDYSAIAKAMTGFDQAIKNLSVESMVALGAILGAGMAIGALTKESTKAKMVTGVAALTAGIAAFFAGFALMDAAATTLGTGDSAKILVKNFSESIGYLDETSMKVLGGLLGAGAIFGATGLAGPAAIGMGAVGVGIGAFFVGLAGAAKVGEFIGVDGSSAKKLIGNLADGLKQLMDLDSDRLKTLGEALPGIGGGIGKFFAADALGSFSETVKEGFAFLFGASEDNKFKKIVTALKPLEDIDPKTTDGLNSILDDLERLGKIRVQNTLGNNIKLFANGLAAAMPNLEAALYGGEVEIPGRNKVIKGLANGGNDLQIAVDALNNITAAATGMTAAGGGGGDTIVNNVDNSQNGGGGTPAIVGSGTGNPRGHPSAGVTYGGIGVDYGSY